MRKSYASFPRMPEKIALNDGAGSPSKRDINADVRTAVIFDLDYTITSVDTYPAFLRKMLARRPSRWLRAAFLPLDFLYSRLGFRDNQWLKERALTVIAGGVAAATLDGCARDTVDALMRSRLRAGALAMLKKHQAAGCRLILATASFDFYTRLLAERLGIQEVVCTESARDEQGRLTGRICGRNCYGEEKLRRMTAALPGPRAAWQVIVYTDHHSDLPVLEWANVPQVVNPKDKMRRVAMERGWKILDW